MYKLSVVNHPIACDSKIAYLKDRISCSKKMWFIQRIHKGAIKDYIPVPEIHHSNSLLRVEHYFFVCQMCDVLPFHGMY